MAGEARPITPFIVAEARKLASAEAIGGSACSTPPRGRHRWSLRLLATEVVRLGLVETVSYETVRQTLKQTR